MGRLAAASAAALLGVVGGGLYLSVVLGSPGGLILVYLTQLPLFAAGLWLGTGAAVIAGATATVMLLAASDLMAAAVFAGLNAVPVALLVRQALLARPLEDGRVLWYPPGLLAAWLTGLALGGMGLTILYFGGPENLHAELSAVIDHTLGRLAYKGPADQAEIADAVATVVPGIVAASWMVMAVVNAALAQGVLARFKLNWRPSPDLAALDLPPWVVVALALAAATTMLGEMARFVGINAVVALSVPLCLAGLAVLHTAMRRLPNPRVGLVVFYTLAGLFGWPLLIAAALGLIEPWARLRRRLSPAKGNLDG